MSVPPTATPWQGSGVFPEIGDERAAFDEDLAKRSIEENGFYRFHSKTFDPVAQPPLSMP
jgi:hypothetical protein